MSSETLPSDDVLFIRLAMKRGILPPEGRDEALALQEKMREMGLIPKPIAAILEERSMMRPEDVQEIIAQVARVRQAYRIPGYRLLKRLGRGSMGTVYKAQQLRLGRDVAIKILAPFLAENEAYVRRFMKEARVVGKLNHPNIVQGFDAGQVDGIWYFAMEYVEGATLLQILQRGAMDEDRAVHIVTQVARALDHAYNQDLVHRDVKPDNIMIVAGGVAKLCDLGLAKDVTRTSGSTEKGVTLGTPHYMSPEQVRGDVDVDIRSDIYSLGATLYHAVAGVPPFSGQNPAVIMVKHLNEPALPPRQRVPTLSAELEPIIMKMLAKNPLDRYQTPSELLIDLENHRARREGRPEPFPRTRKKAP
ncbi:MAG TPA: serine/threonine-protein kinase [Planctomycetota bacterium]|nr:serine/threonine-protein kinase [Planctomycetota bacterium]